MIDVAMRKSAAAYSADIGLKLNSTDAGHFYLLGADQLMHNLTYVGIVAVLISA